MTRRAFFTVPFTVVLKTFFQTYTENWLHSATAQQIFFSLFTFQLGYKIMSSKKNHSRLSW